MFRKSDKQIVRRVLAGGQEDYGILVERYGSMAHAMAYARTGNRTDAEDITQDAFLTAFLKLDTLRDPSSFAPWLIAIVRHAAGKLVARRDRDHEHAMTHPDRAVLPDVEQRELHEQVRMQVMELEEPAREILLLYYFAAHNTREIARILGLTPDAVEKRLQRARAQVGEALLRRLGPAMDMRAEAAARRKRVMGMVGAVGAAASRNAAAGTVGSFFATAASKLLFAGSAALAIGALTTVYTTLQPSFQRGAVSPTPSANVGRINSTSSRSSAAEAAVATTPRAGISPAVSLPVGHGPGHILGRTIDADDRPVPNAEVTLTETDWMSYDPPAPSPPPRTCTSDASGRFDFGDLPLRDYGLLVRSGDLVALSGASPLELEPEEELELVLLPAGQLSGRVVDAEFRPVAGAWVVPVVCEGDGRYVPHSSDGEGDDFSSGMAKILGAWTDVDGRFRINDLHPGAWQLAARAEGYAWTKSPFNAVNSESVEWKLDPESRIGGRIVDADGRPVSNADVSIEGEGLLGRTQIQTGADGAFLFANLSAGAYELDVSHDTLAAAETPMSVALDVGEAKTGLELELAVGASIAGRVFDEDTSRGIPGAVVYATGRQGKEATTDADGRFRISGLGPGEYSISVSRAWGYPGSDPNPKTVVDWGQVVEGIDIRLSSGTAVSGRVCNPDGLPVAAVKILAVSGDQQEAFGMSGPDGTFMLGGLNPDKTIRLYAAKNRMIAQSDELHVPREGMTGIALVLEQGASLRGRVLDAAGNRVRFPDVRFEPEGDRFFLWGEISYSMMGVFNARGLLPGGYTLSAAPDHDSKQRGEPMRVTLEPGTPIEDLVLVASAPNAGPAGPRYSVDATAVDERGKHIAGVEIFASDASGSGSPCGVTDDRGRIHVDDVPAGAYTLWADSEGYRAAPVQIEVPASARIVLSGTRAGRIDGRVLDSYGHPVREFSVLVLEREFAWSGLPLKAPDQANEMVSDNGDFSVNAHSETTGVAVWATGFTPTLLEVPAIAPGETVKGLVIRLDPETVVAGDVADSNGIPIAGAGVFARTLPPEESPRDELLPSTSERETMRIATTDAEGRFEARGLPAIPLRIWASDEKHETTSQIVVPEPGRTTNAQFVLGVGGRVEGAVTLAGKPVPDAYVDVTVYGPQAGPSNELAGGGGGGLFVGRGGNSPGPELARERTKTDPNGLFAVDGLPEGPALVATSIPLEGGPNSGQRSLREEVLVQDGETIRVDLVFTDDGAELTGTLTVGGVPVLSGEIFMVAPAAFGESISFPAKDGAFRCTGLPAGTWSVSASNAQVQPDDYRHSDQPIPLELHAGATTQLDIDLPLE